MSENVFDKLYQHSFVDDNVACFWLNRYVRFIKQCQQKNHAFEHGEGTMHVHHIFPRSWGGDNDPNNLVVLTIKEHLVAHHLLSRTNDRYMVYGFWIMVQTVPEQFNYNVSIKLATEAAEKYNKSERLNGKHVVNLNTKQVFNSIRAGAKSVNRDESTLVRAIEDQRRCGGCYWAYADNLEDISEKSINAKLDEILEIIKTNKKSWDQSHCSPIVNLTTKEFFLHLNDAARAYQSTGAVIKFAALKGQKAKNCWWATLDQFDDLSSESIQRQIEFLESQIPIKRKLRDQRCVKKVLNETTGEVFDSVYDVCDKYNLKCSGHVAKCCRKHIKLCKCYWRYIK